MRHALGAGMRAVRRGERVVDVDVGEFRQFGGEGGVVLFFLGVVAGVLQHQDVAARHALHRLLGGDADAVLGEADTLAKDLTKRRGHRGKRHLRHALTFRAVEVAAHDDLGALAGEFADGGGQALDAGQVGDFAVAHGDVQVGAQQDALAGDVQVIKGTEGHEKLH